MALTPDQFLESSVVPDSSSGSDISSIGAAFGIFQAERTTKKDYRGAYSYINITSNSQQGILSECARKFQIMKTSQAVSGTLGSASLNPNELLGLGAANLDFVFGHAVGAGVQTYLATKNKAAALFACFLSWTADYDSALEKKKKSSSYAALAVEKFIYFWEERNLGIDWEVAEFNGNLATEFTFLIDCENGYYHAGHVDAVLKHKKTGRYMVLEIKTTAIRNIDEAQYGNSGQALGYSVVVDKVAEDLKTTQEFEVLYLVYSSTNKEWVPLPFTKSRTSRLEWLQDLLLDHADISTYRKLNYFPKNGDSCWSFGGRCEHYGICDLKAMQKTNFKVFEANADKSNLPEKVDFFFTLEELSRAAIQGAVSAT